MRATAMATATVRAGTPTSYRLSPRGHGVQRSVASCRLMSPWGRGMRRAMVGLLAVVVVVMGADAAAAAPADKAERSYATEIFSLINGARADAGLVTLLGANGTTQVSDAWVAGLASSHQVAANPDLAAQLRAHGSAAFRIYGETAGLGPRDNPRQVYDNFQASDSNRRAMLDPAFRYVGLSAAFAGDTAYVVADFVDTYVEAVPARSATPSLRPNAPAAPTASAASIATSTPQPSETTVPAQSESALASPSDAPVLDRAVTTPSKDTTRLGLFAAFGGILDGVLIVALAVTLARRRQAVDHDDYYYE